MQELPAEIPASERHSRRNVAKSTEAAELSSASSNRMRDAASRLGDGSIIGVERQFFIQRQ